MRSWQVRPSPGAHLSDVREPRCVVGTEIDRIMNALDGATESLQTRTALQIG